MTDRSAQASPLAAAVATLHPAYFALVMATGIVSIASHLMGLGRIAQGLFALNVGFYATLWVLVIVRIARFRPEVLSDLWSHGRSVGFFTAVAATCVLGSECVVIRGAVWAGLWLWLLAIALWALLTYAIFTILIVKPEKPPLAEGINGGWLVAVVAAQSVAVLGAQLAPGLGSCKPQILFFCLAMWLGGGMLYLWIIGLIFYRYTFFSMSPSDLAPPYWINMGAVAISTLGGTMLIAAAPLSEVLQATLPFIRGLTLMWWATATWWIPMLVILGVWRHGFRRFPLRYDPLYWGAVFPLGMYTAATARLSVSLRMPFLMAIPRVSLYVALVAWTAAMLGLAHRVFRISRKSDP